MTSYPPANTTTAWYQDDHPGTTMKPTRVVIHTTEGRTLPGYDGGAIAPTYTAVPDMAAKRLKWYAHFPDERSARALRNEAGGVETNTLGAIQVELVGTCDPATSKSWGTKAHVLWSNPPAWAVAELAKFVAWVSKAHGIPIYGPADVWTAYPASYGAGGQRFTADKWRGFRGFCGHQHVPENVHGDPGAFPWGAVAIAAKGAAKAPVPTPLWDGLYEATDRLARAATAALSSASGTSKIALLARRTRLRRIRDWAASYSSRY